MDDLIPHLMVSSSSSSGGRERIASSSKDFPAILQTSSALPSTEDIQDMLPHLTPQQLADAIWGFAKLGVTPAADFMAMVTEEVRSKLGQFRSQDLSNTIWALAVLKYQPEEAWWDEFERQARTSGGERG